MQSSSPKWSTNAIWTRVFPSEFLRPRRRSDLLYIPEQVDLDSRTITEAYTVTKPEVIHAEANALFKLTRHGDSCLGGSIFITHSPCVECAKMILQSGIREVYYKKDYRSDDGIRLLTRGKIKVLKV